MLSRPGCHLCDDARVELARLAEALGQPWVERNILDDPGLHRRYADYVPVVCVDDAPVCWFRVDEALIRSALAREPSG